MFNIIDPSCGSGGFLIEALRYVWKKIDEQGAKYNWTDIDLEREKAEFAQSNIAGIDKDYFLAKVAKAYLAILGVNKSGIYCEDSLDRPDNWNEKTKMRISKGKLIFYLRILHLVLKFPFREKISWLSMSWGISG